MIEPALYFLLGFLSSGLLALMIAPAIWSRAVRLTRQRIEASQPLTLAEIKADRDQLRADFAVTSRRLELNISDLRARTANQRIDVARALGERDTEIKERKRLAEDIKMYELELSSRGEGLAQLQSELRNAHAETDQRNHLINGLETRISELNAEIDNRKLEIASFNARLEAAGSQTDSLMESHRLVETRVANLTNEIERRGTVITEERERAERLLAELASLKRTGRAPVQQAAGFGEPMPAAERDDNERPEISRLEAENMALEGQLRDLSSERDRLAEELQAAKVRDLSAPADAADLAVLKDHLGDIAARIAHMTAERDGPKGPVDLLVANLPQPGPPAPGQDNDDRQAINPASRRLDSLAEKIQALRKASSANEEA